MRPCAGYRSRMPGGRSCCSAEAIGTSSASKRSETGSAPGHTTNLVHPWEQPLAPWAYWLRSLSRPGELIADAFSGVGKTGVTAKLAGVRSWIGTEKNSERAKVARAR